MPTPTPSELKKVLLAQGFEVYRTLADRVVLAERVRDNLIMDSGVAVLVRTELVVRFVARAQGSDFPGENSQHLMDRARAQGEATTRAGYTEVESQVVPIRDPSDRERTLDTWYEVSFEKCVAGVPELIVELRFALGLEKTAAPTRA